MKEWLDKHIEEANRDIRFIDSHYKEPVSYTHLDVYKRQPSEGYLLDTTVHKVGAEPQLYTVEHNQTANDVTEQVVKGNIAIIKHTDNGETQIETCLLYTSEKSCT